MEEYGKTLCVCGYHVYCKIWEAKVGETLLCEREQRNAHDSYAVCMQPVNYYSLELIIHSSKNFVFNFRR